MLHDDEPSLEVSYSLDLIMGYLEDKALSKTKIMNYLGLGDAALAQALEFGCDSGFLKREEFNFYRAIKTYKIPESSFYPIVKTCIENLWRTEKYNNGEFYIEQTARKDSKIAGPWTRPDLTLVSYKKFPWTIGHEFDVVTFEVKRPDSCNVLAVFEALSHGSAATRAYVVFSINWKVWKKEDPDQEKRVMDECSKHGVGLILVENVYENASPRHILKARKREIDHEKCSSFLDAVVTSDGKNRISTWK